MPRFRCILAAAQGLNRSSAAANKKRAGGGGGPEHGGRQMGVAAYVKRGAQSPFVCHLSLSAGRGRRCHGDDAAAAAASGRRRRRRRRRSAARRPAAPSIKLSFSTLFEQCSNRLCDLEVGTGHLHCIYFTLRM